MYVSMCGKKIWSNALISALKEQGIYFAGAERIEARIILSPTEDMGEEEDAGIYGAEALNMNEKKRKKCLEKNGDGEMLKVFVYLCLVCI